MRGWRASDLVAAIGDFAAVVGVDAVSQGTLAVGGVADTLEVLHGPGISFRHHRVYSPFLDSWCRPRGAGRGGEDGGEDCGELDDEV